MKLNVTVDLDELTLGELYYGNDGDLTLSDVIKNDIANKVKENIVKTILKKYEDELTKVVGVKVSSAVEKLLEDFKNSDETFPYTPPYQNKAKYITFREFVKNKFTDTLSNSYAVCKIENTAKDFVKELKDRYDITFASLIVKNMQKQKLLADDKIAELIKK